MLRKKLTFYLDKGFIRVSKLSAAASILFIRKLDGGL
jgi:hypothetical protein